MADEREFGVTTTENEWGVMADDHGELDGTVTPSVQAVNYMGQRLTVDQALHFAAWLAVTADPGGRKFAAVLKAVRAGQPGADT